MRNHADAVVHDRQYQGAIIQLQTNADLGGRCVFDCIGDRLLGDSIQVGRNDVVRQADLFLALEDARNFEPRCHVQGQLFQAGHEALGFQFYRIKTARDVPRLGDGVIQQAGDAVGLAPFGNVFGGQVLLEHVAVKSCADEDLAKTVVQILADARLLPVADLDQLPLELPDLRDINRNAANESFS